MFSAYLKVPCGSGGFTGARGPADTAAVAPGLVVEPPAAATRNGGGAAIVAEPAAVAAEDEGRVGGATLLRSGMHGGTMSPGGWKPMWAVSRARRASVMLMVLKCLCGQVRHTGREWV